MQRIGLGIIIALTCGLAACGTVTAPQLAGDMKISIQIKDYQQGSTPVGIHFATAATNETIQFVSGETVACNGAFLKYDSNPIERLIVYGSYIGEVPNQPSNGMYTVTYTPAKGTGIDIPIKVIAAPVTVAQPTNGSNVAIPKSGALVINYTPTQLANTTILAVAVDSRGNFTVTLPTSETGTLSIPASQFTAFQPGAGDLSLVRITTNMLGGTPFKEVKVEYQNITKLQVVWQ